MHLWWVKAKVIGNIKILHFPILLILFCNQELSPKIVAKAFQWKGEVEAELRRLGQEDQI